VAYLGNSCELERTRSDPHQAPQRRELEVKRSSSELKLSTRHQVANRRCVPLPAARRTDPARIRGLGDLPQWHCRSMLSLPHDIGDALVCTVNDFSPRLLALWVDARNATILSAACLLVPTGRKKQRYLLVFFCAAIPLGLGPPVGPLGSYYRKRGPTPALPAGSNGPARPALEDAPPGPHRRRLLELESPQPHDVRCAAWPIATLLL
jgi:hypothetical protein